MKRNGGNAESNRTSDPGFAVPLGGVSGPRGGGVRSRDSPLLASKN